MIRAQLIPVLYRSAILAGAADVCAGFCAIENYGLAFKVLIGASYVLMGIAFVTAVVHEVLDKLSAKKTTKRS